MNYNPSLGLFSADPLKESDYYNLICDGEGISAKCAGKN